MSRPGSKGWLREVVGWVGYRIWWMTLHKATEVSEFLDSSNSFGFRFNPGFVQTGWKHDIYQNCCFFMFCFTTSLKKIWFLDSKDVNIPFQATSATSFVSLRIWRSWLTSMIWMFSAQKIIDHSVRWFDLMPKDPIWYISHFFVFNRGSQILQWLVILVFYIDLIDQGYLVFL